MVDETEFDIMDADDRPTNESCDECGKKSIFWHQDEIDDEMMEGLHEEGWLYSEGVMYCDECKHTCRVK